MSKLDMFFVAVGLAVFISGFVICSNDSSLKRKLDAMFHVVGLAACVAGAAIWCVATPYLGKMVTGGTQPDQVVKVIDNHGSFTYTSSGCAISPSLILTCYHAISSVGDGGNLTIVNSDGSSETASILATDKKNDLALLKVKYKWRAVYKIATFPSKKNQPVSIQGFPKGKNYAQVHGLVRDFIGSPKGFTISDKVIQGMSGGPALNNEKLVVGVVFGSSEREAYCSGLEGIRKLVKKHLD
jgi:hypothetical protein